jgi:hypothetical protein
VALVRRTATTSRAVKRTGARPASRRASTAGLVKGKPRGRRVVKGLVMVPVASAPMAAQPSSPGTASQSQPTAGAAPQRQVPAQPRSPGALPGGGVLPVALPDPSPPPPSGDQVTTVVGELLSGGSPPPPRIAGDFGTISSRAAGFVAFR